MIGYTLIPYSAHPQYNATESKGERGEVLTLDELPSELLLELLQFVPIEPYLQSYGRSSSSLIHLSQQFKGSKREVLTDQKRYSLS